MYDFRRLMLLNRLPVNAQHHNKTMMKNMMKCTHLSKWIFVKKLSLGISLPGIVSKTVEIISHVMAGTKEG